MPLANGHRSLSLCVRCSSYMNGPIGELDHWGLGWDLTQRQQRRRTAAACAQRLRRLREIPSRPSIPHPILSIPSNSHPRPPFRQAPKKEKYIIVTITPFIYAIWRYVCQKHTITSSRSHPPCPASQSCWQNQAGSRQSLAKQPGFTTGGSIQCSEDSIQFRNEIHTHELCATT